jgi:hypothetical protein
MSGLEHEIAIDISRALNLVNPNDLLARQVIQIARNHKQANGFVKGKKKNKSANTNFDQTISFVVQSTFCSSEICTDRVLNYLIEKSSMCWIREVQG